MPSRLGSPNKQKAFLLKRLQDMFGEQFDPIIKAAERAHSIDQMAIESDAIEDHKSALAAWVAVGEFVTPKLKAVEVKSDEGLTVSVIRKRYDAAPEKVINGGGSVGLQASDSTALEEAPPIEGRDTHIYIPPPQKKIK